MRKNGPNSSDTGAYRNQFTSWHRIMMSLFKNEFTKSKRGRKLNVLKVTLEERLDSSKVSLTVEAVPVRM